MSRRRQHEEHAENHERWLVSYADFITLMFAFFVVMFATSESDKAKTKAVATAVENALKDDKFSARVKAALSGSTATAGSSGGGLTSLKNHKTHRPDEPQFAELTPSLKKLTAELEPDIQAGRLQVSLEPRGLVISLKEGAFFSPGDDTLNRDRLGSLAKLAAVIRPLPNPVRLEGHTDAVPIKNSRFRNNWELSAARSIAVLRLLNEEFQVAEKRMAIVGYADKSPMESNDTDAGRARNRRVDITILNESATSKEAKPAA
jgi:chemotaxis protein MotB